MQKETTTGLVLGISIVIFCVYIMYFRWKRKTQNIKESEEYLFENNYDRIRCSL